jgi:peptidoglycan/xylan/chitin deacetylase (PgdA/CDA1 family)
MMTSQQVATLAQAGFELGGHTVTHPILAQIDEATAREEIERGRQRIDELAGARTRLFAYPNGKPGRDYHRKSTRLVEALRFDGAVTTSSGAARVGCSPYEIPRFTPWDCRRAYFALQLWSNAVCVTADVAAS